MKVGIQMALSAIAICVSIAAVFYSANVAKQISSSDYQAAQQVKSDTAKLLSSLASIGEKWALERHREGEGSRYDIALEQEVISDFINSQSAIAFRGWIGESETKRRGDWTPFFLNLQDISTGGWSDFGPSQLSSVVTLIESLNDTDVRNIVGHTSDLIEVISSSKSSKSSPIVQAILGKYKPIDRDEAIEQLKWLKEGGVNDPDVELWLGVLISDAEAVRRALAEGAVYNIPLPVVMDRYRDRLQKGGHTPTQ